MDAIDLDYLETDMTEGMEAITKAAVAVALDAASLRHQAITTNIANANAAGYVPQRVSFEAQLDEVRRGLEGAGTVDRFALGQVRPHLEPALDPMGTPADVQLDVEMAELARNAVHYQALLKGLSRHFAILSMAASDGRR